MGKNLTIFQKGVLLSAVPLLMQLIVLGVLGKLQYDRNRAGDWAVHSKAVIAQAESTYRRVVEAQSAMRGLVLTGQPTFAASYHQAAQSLPEELHELEVLVIDAAAQQAKVRDLRAHMTLLLEQLQIQEQLVQAGRSREATDRVRDSTGQELLKSLRDEVSRFLVEEERLDRERHEALQRASSWANWALAGGGVLAVFTTALLALLFSQGVTRRLTVLSDNARLLTENKALAKPMTGRDEIAQVDRAFHDLADTLAQKSQENELFVYSVSHDLRSPLVNLQGFSQELNLACADLRRLLAGADVPVALRERITAVLEGNVAEATHFIQTAVSRLSGIIDALLRLSRAGRVEYRPQAVDLRVTVGRVVEALRGTISQRGAEVVVHELPPCWADATAVEQIFANLIGNAVNYLDPSRPGRVEVASAREDPE